LHATVSLARLLRDTSRRDEARTMLAEIHNWFTEGFDTADLKEAKGVARSVDLVSQTPKAGARARMGCSEVAQALALGVIGVCKLD
jgi:hypothetical protein